MLRRSFLNWTFIWEIPSPKNHIMGGPGVREMSLYFYFLNATSNRVWPQCDSAETETKLIATLRNGHHHLERELNYL